MKKIKKLVAAAMASAMVLGMSLTTFAADTAALKLDAAIKTDEKKATFMVKAENADINGMNFTFKYDTAVFENPVVDTSALAAAGLMPMVNTAVAGEVRCPAAGANAVIAEADKAYVTITLDIKEVDDATLKTAIESATLTASVLKNADSTVAIQGGKDVATGEAAPESKIEKADDVIVTPEPTPEATTPAPEATTPAPEATTPAPEATTPAPAATTPAPVASTTAPTTVPTTAPSTSPKTADTASVVLPVVVLCAAAAAVVVASKKRVEE